MHGELVPGERGSVAIRAVVDLVVVLRHGLHGLRIRQHVAVGRHDLGLLLLGVVRRVKEKIARELHVLLLGLADLCRERHQFVRVDRLEIECQRSADVLFAEMDLEFPFVERTVCGFGHHEFFIIVSGFTCRSDK